MAIGDIYRATWVWSDGVTGENVTCGIHVRQESITHTPENIFANMVDWWTNDDGTNVEQRAYHPDELVLQALDLRRVVPPENVVTVSTTSLPIPGTDTNDNLAQQVSMLLSLRTAKIGRSYRGRMYLPPTCEDQENASGVLTEAIAGGIAGRFQSFVQALAIDDYTTGVFSPTRYEGPGTDYFNPLEAIYCDRILRTQRRRAGEASVYVAAP